MMGDVLSQKNLLRFLRYWLPAIVCASGIAYAASRGFDDTGLDGASALMGAGLSIYLINLLFRIGVTGDTERDEEDDARAFFDRYGMWPDEVPPGWKPPAGDPRPRGADLHRTERRTASTRTRRRRGA